MTCYFDKRWCGEHGIGRFASEVSRKLVLKHYDNAKKPMSPLDPFRLSFDLMRKLDKENDWFFSPGYNAPFWSSIPYILTLHDLNHLDRPENSNLFKRIYYEYILKSLCLRARAIFTVSEFSKDRIIEWSGINPERVFNVGNGVSDVFGPVGKFWTVVDRYVLCVSNRRGHKNEPNIIRAFAYAKLDSDIKLVFTGSPTKELENLVQKLGMNDRVVFAGRLSETELAAVYRSAICLCFAPHYEGFGLPIIEAFASGLPVITSNTSSMPEIAGDAAVFVTPSEVKSISAALISVCSDIDLRKRLIDMGFDRAKKFSWDAVSERISNSIRNVGLKI